MYHAIIFVHALHLKLEYYEFVLTQCRYEISNRGWLYLSSKEQFFYVHLGGLKYWRVVITIELHANQTAEMNGRSDICEQSWNQTTCENIQRVWITKHMIKNRSNQPVDLYKIQYGVRRCLTFSTAVLKAMTHILA